MARDGPQRNRKKMTDLRAGKVVSVGLLSEFVRAKTPFSAVPVTRSGTL